MIHLYKVNRATEDLDAVEIVPGDEVRHMLALAGRDSPLQKKHRVYLDYVRVATYPQDYEARLVPMYHGAFEHLELLALDPYDVVLCKIERNSPKDRYDVEALGVSIPLNTASLRERYERELRPNLLNPSPCDLTSNSGSR